MWPNQTLQRAAVDIVGLIYPMTDRMNRYILTIVDCETRCPEAVALRNIEAHTVAETLVTTFSGVGHPILIACTVKKNRYEL